MKSHLLYLRLLANHTYALFQWSVPSTTAFDSSPEQLAIRAFLSTNSGVDYNFLTGFRGMRPGDEIYIPFPGRKGVRLQYAASGWTPLPAGETVDCNGTPKPSDLQPLKALVLTYTKWPDVAQWYHVRLPARLSAYSYDPHRLATWIVAEALAGENFGPGDEAYFPLISPFKGGTRLIYDGERWEQLGNIA